MDVEVMEGQMSLFGQEDTAFGKTCPERSAQTAGGISKQSSRSSSASPNRKPPMFLSLTRGGGPTQDASLVWEPMVSPFPWLGVSMMHSIGVSRNGAKDYAYWLTTVDLQRRGFCLTLNMSERPRTDIPSRLSDILERNPDQKYRLSERACQGILNRAERRGKELPAELKRALEEQATPSKLGGGVERDSNGRKAGKGALVQEERSGTLGVSQDQTLIQAFGIGSYDSNAMKSPNPRSGIYKAETSRTLDLNGGSPACNQGGMAVVYPLEGNGQRDSHYGSGYGSADDPSFTLNTIERHAVAAVDCRNGTEDPNINGTLQAKSNGGYNTNSNNVVRVQACDVYNQTVDGDVAPTVTAATGGANTSGPKVLTAGFKPRQSSAARTLGWQSERSPTIQTDQNYAVFNIERNGNE